MMKRMKMAENLAKRKRSVESDDSELAEPFQNDTHFDKFGQGTISSKSYSKGQVFTSELTD